MLFHLYKRAFQASETSIWWGGETITRVWNDNTMFLYCGIILFVMILSFFAEKKRVAILYGNQQRHLLLKGYSYTVIAKNLKFIFFILLLIMGFRHTEVGIDTIVYKGGIEQDITLAERFLESTTEPLYKIFQHILHRVFDNGVVGVFIYSFATLYFLYGGLKRYIGDLNIFVALLVYVCIFYFPALNLLRISLAASIIFYYFHYVVEGKYTRFILVLLLTSLVHYSCIVMFLPFFTYLLYRKNRMIAAVIYVSLAFFIVVSTYVLSNYISFINRYSGYIETNDSSGRIGIMLFLDYLPCLIICYYIIMHKIRGEWADLMVTYTISAFLIRLMAYFIQVAGRLNYHFPILLMLLLPYWIFYLRKKRDPFYKPILYCSVIWSLFRLHIYFIGYLSTDGIMPYKFFWQ